MRQKREEGINLLCNDKSINGAKLKWSNVGIIRNNYDDYIQGSSEEGGQYSWIDELFD
jgi:hypothetical protein